MSIGEALASARTEAGLTVEDVSRATRIRGPLVQAIERDDFAACGGGIYARGHIRAMCAVLDLDAAPFVREFDRLHSRDVAGPGVRAVFEHEVVAKADRTGPNWTAAMAVAAAVLLTVAVIGLFSKGGPTGAPPPVANNAVLPHVSTTPSTSPSVNVSPTTDPLALLPKNGVFVRVRITGDKCWVHATQDGTVVFQGILSTGQLKDFRANREIRLVLGKPGAVDLVVNGRDLGAPGTNDHALHLTFGPGDPSGSTG